MIELIGCSNTGKTQLSLQLSCIAAYNNIYGIVYYIDINNQCNMSRAHQMLQYIADVVFKNVCKQTNNNISIINIVIIH